MRANAVGVGVITDGLYHALVERGDFDERFLEASRQAKALKRLGTAEEVAEGVVFLASAARALDHRAETLMVDGGVCPMKRTKPPFRADQVGSLLRSQPLTGGAHKARHGRDQRRPS